MTSATKRVVIGALIAIGIASLPLLAWAYYPGQTRGVPWCTQAVNPSCPCGTGDYIDSCTVICTAPDCLSDVFLRQQWSCINDGGTIHPVSVQQQTTTMPCM